MIWLLVLLIVVVVALSAYVIYSAFNIRSTLFINAVCTSPSGSPLLTFDDGPDPVNTPRLLSVLRSHNHKAIFFLIGEKVDKYPEVVRQIVAEGHQVGNHTYSHQPMANFLGASHLLLEIRRCDDAIFLACGVRPTLFRPPLGISTHYMRSVLRHTGHRVIGWSVRSLDTLQERHRRTPQQVLSRVVCRLRKDSIVLLHDRLSGVDTLADQILQKCKEL